jgi:CII-binding regulator of phage lambda lysogenization HflD
MEIKKNNGRYYVNNLDLEELLSNRKHLINYLEEEISYLEDMKKDTELYEFTLKDKVRLNTLQEIRKEMNLRR